MTSARRKILIAGMGTSPSVLTNAVWARDEENGSHLRVTERMPKAEVGRVIDELMTRKPLRGGAW